MEAVLMDAFPEESTKITEVVNEIKRLRDERHQITHWIWSREFADRPDDAFNVSARPYRDEKVKIRNARQIEKIARDMIKTAKELVRFRDRLLKKLART